ncbi:MAG: glycosyltransferase [Candidatus Aminicenantes bacterium]|nr:glycosyltransferase [Candidatus Aminicenantes bacterium]
MSEELGLTDRHVFFHDWIPYDERESYLLEADLGLSLHLDHVETRFAFRNRILDYIWAGLPIISTQGDTASELVAQHNLGSVVDYQDVPGVAHAILELLDIPDLKKKVGERVSGLIPKYQWSQTTQPLVAFCQSPRFAPDRGKLKKVSLNTFEASQVIKEKPSSSRFPWSIFLSIVRNSKGRW